MTPHHRNWNAPNLPHPAALDTLAGQIVLTHWLAGMGPMEMVRWAGNGGWIPPVLRGAFEAAAVGEAVKIRDVG